MTCNFVQLLSSNKEATIQLESNLNGALTEVQSRIFWDFNPLVKAHHNATPMK
jgi:hypothetical protein